MILIFILALTLIQSTASSAFTLMMSQPPRYQTSEVLIRIGSHDCSELGLTAQELKSMVQLAVDEFWNSVPSSRIRLKTGDFVDVATNASLTDLLLSIESNQIIVACSNNSELFESTAILAVGTLTVSTPPRGVVALNNLPGSVLGEDNEAIQRATIAHELGHALGIGHSTHSYALMYFSISDAIQRTSLARDDADAITYLYPKKSTIPLLLGGCGSIVKTNDFQNSQSQNSLFFLMVILVGWACCFGIVKKPFYKRLTR